MSDAVILKSLPGRMVLYLNNEISFDELLFEIARKFAQAQKFFRDAEMAITFEGRELSAMEECRIIDTIAQSSRVRISCIVSKTEEGIVGESVEELKKSLFARRPEGEFIFESLEAGDVFEAREGVVVFGDLKKGAEIVAKGDVVVFGKLAGTVRIIGEEAEDCLVACLELAPEEIRIGSCFYRHETKEKEKHRFSFGQKKEEETAAPVILSVVNGKVFVKHLYA